MKFSQTEFHQQIINYLWYMGKGPFTACIKFGCIVVEYWTIEKSPKNMSKVFYIILKKTFSGLGTVTRSQTDTETGVWNLFYLSFHVFFVYENSNEE